MDALRQLTALIDENENILWYGKPDKKCFLLEAVFNPLLPFALLWGLFDFSFIAAILISKPQGNLPPLLILVPFFILHLMPVWIYLAGVLFSFKNYKCTCFVITEKGVYASGGFLSTHFQHKTFDEIADVSVRQGFFDKKLNVGDVIIADRNPDINSAPANLQEFVRGGTSFPISAKNFRIELNKTTVGNKHNPADNNIVFHDIPDFTEVYHLISDRQAKHKK